MPLSVRAVLLSAALALILPATSFAKTLTVDPSHAAGCGATDNTCKTISDALGAAVQGDVIKVLKGTYAENVSIPSALQDLQIEGAPDVKITGAGSGDVVTVSATGVQIGGVTVEVPGAAGSAVRVDADSAAVLKNLVATRTAASTSGEPLIHSAGTLQVATALLAQQTGAAGTPAIVSSGAGGVQLADVIALSLTGPAARITASDKNTIARSTLISGEATQAASNAVELLSADAGARKLVADSSILVGGANASGLVVRTSGSEAGDAAADLRHVTIAGAAGGIVLDATAAEGPGIPSPAAVGNIDVDVASSIVHGTSKADAYAPPLPLLSTGNTATLTFSNSDAPPAQQGPNATVTMGSASNTPDEQLFGKGFTLRADAPLIDKGGPLIAGESDKDVQGDPRLVGAATDIGADEYVNQPPVSAFGVTKATPRQNEEIGFVSGSTDPEEVAKAGGKITEFRWDFGDGAKQTTTVGAVTHAYANTGTYTATLTVVDDKGLVSAPATQKITVTDGIAPVATIDTPAYGARLPLNPAAPKRRKGSKRKPRRPRPLPLTALGKATDVSGITKVEVSLVRTKRDKVRRKRRARRSQESKATCEHYSGRLFTRRRACDQLTWITVPVKAGAWEFTTRRRLRLLPGRYELRVRATDATGLVSAVFSREAKSLVKFRVR